jgi:hypothetical protein
MTRSVSRCAQKFSLKGRIPIALKLLPLGRPPSVATRSSARERRASEISLSATGGFNFVTPSLLQPVGVELSTGHGFALLFTDDRANL